MKKTICLLLAALSLTATAQTRKSGSFIITRENGHTRAMECFGGTTDGGSWYSDALNSYRRALPDSVRLYSMIIPTAVAFYCPDEAQQWTKDEAAVIRAIYARMDRGVTTVDAYAALLPHTSEPIYSRTDHHYAPLGAYYCAWEFARVAGVPFRFIEDYDARTVHRYVGSLGRWTKDAAVKNDPEDFVYYVPRDTDYTVTYRDHRLSGKKVTSVSEPFSGPFFLDYKDGSAGAYCTFMGGDTRTTHIRTNANTGRRLLIIKDSYGNALPGYLFQAFSDIYVTDFRYFTRNIITYARENHVTDLLIANNLQHAYAKGTANGLMRMLEQ